MKTSALNIALPILLRVSFFALTFGLALRWDYQKQHTYV